MLPTARAAHECDAPATVATTPVRPLTATGVEVFAVVPLPNCPDGFAPQHFMEPSANCAHECASPARTATPPAETVSTPERPVTLTGMDELVVPPFPNWPELLAPQHVTVRLTKSAHE